MPLDKVTGLILAGGQAKRMGGEDKGLLLLDEQPMIQHVIERLQPQVDRIIINANRNGEAYSAFELPVLTDSEQGFLGPLAGMLAGMRGATTGYIVTAPCDTPLIPMDLVERLSAALHQQEADLAVVHDGERLHPVLCLLRIGLHRSLEEYLESGERKIDRWFAQHKVAEVDFSDQKQAFQNVNTPEDLQQLSQQLREQ